MQAYERSLENDQTTLVLSPDSAFFQFLKDPNSQISVKGLSTASSASSNKITKILASGNSLSSALCPEIIVDEAKITPETSFQ